LLQRQKELVDFERRVLTEYSRGYRQWYFWSEKVLGKFKPLKLWWYGNKAERALERYKREKTAECYKLWYEAEVRAARARGVVYSSATAVRNDGEGLMTVLVPPHLLRMSRRGEGRPVTSWDDVEKRKDVL
jgi:hypothetical protein